MTKGTWNHLGQKKFGLVPPPLTQSSEASLPRQKYSWRRLLALGQDGEQYVDSFRWSRPRCKNLPDRQFSRFPSCCVCYSKKTFHHNFALLRTTASDNNNNSVLTPSTNSLLGLLFQDQSEVTTPRSRRWPARVNSLLAGGGSEASRQAGRGKAGCRNGFCRRMLEGSRRRRRNRRLRR